MPLSKRFYNHKAESAAKRNPNRRLFVHANQVGWAECQIVLVENFPCNSSDELRQREEYHRRQVSPQLCLNAQRCFTTRDDINKDRRVQRANDPEYRKLCNQRSNQWAKDHPEHMLRLLRVRTDRSRPRPRRTPSWARLGSGSVELPRPGIAQTADRSRPGRQGCSRPRSSCRRTGRTARRIRECTWTEANRTRFAHGGAPHQRSRRSIQPAWPRSRECRRGRLAAGAHLWN